MKLLAWGRLVRLSLTASAAADAAAGVVLGAGAWPGAGQVGAGPWLQLAGSLCVYHGGMALNDWADREEDARVRPDRPIPSGAVSANGALALAAGLLAAGPLLAFLGAGAGPALLLGAVALGAVLYDTVGRGPLRGPLLLGLCRAGNLGAGVLAGAALAGRAGGALGSGVWALVALYGAYVFAVSCLGRLEDVERAELSSRVPRLAIGFAAAALAAVPWIEPGFARGAESRDWVAQVAGTGGVALALLAAWTLARKLGEPGPWTPGRVLGAMGLALRRLLVFTAVAALGVAAATGERDGLVVGVAILGGYPLSFALRRVFPPS